MALGVFPRAVIFKPWYESESAGGCVITTPHPVSDLVGLVGWGGEWGLRKCISNKLPDDTDAAGPETTPPRTTVLEKHTDLLLFPRGTFNVRQA